MSPQTPVFEQACEGHGMKCSDLNMIVPRSGTISKFGFVVEGAAFLEKVCHFGGGIETLRPRCLEDSLLLDTENSRCRTLSSF